MALTEHMLVDYLRRTTPLNGATVPETPLFSSGALDSVAMLELLSFVEESAGIEIRAEDVTLDNFDTAIRIVAFAERHAR